MVDAFETSVLDRTVPDTPATALTLPCEYCVTADEALGTADDPVGLRRHQLRHDIHSTVATISMLAAAMTPDGDDARAGQLRPLLGELHRLSMLVQSADRVYPARPTRVDLLVHELVATLRLTTTTRLDCRVSEAWSYADPLELWRAVRNLLDNAVRAAGGAGSVSVRVSVRDGWTLTVVEDDGPGFGAAPAGKDSLGLTIVRTFAERCGGHLVVERGRDGGCAVSVYLPPPASVHAHPDTGAVDEAEAAAPVTARSLRLLICDDHRLFSESLATVLKEHGYEVVAVTHTAAEAAEVLAGTRVDVCLLDLWLDGESVLDLVPELRRAARGTRFLLLSGHLSRNVLVAAAAVGIDRCLHKTQPIEDIVEVLEGIRAGGPRRAARPVSREPRRTRGTSRTRETRPPSQPRQPRQTMESPPRDDAHLLASYLTEREKEVLARLVQGETTATLATSMAISRNTARSHVQRVLTKLGVHSRLEAAAFAVRHGLVRPGEMLRM